MYSTTALVKNSKLSGKIIGTHQQIDQIARKLLARHLPYGRYFPSQKEIVHFEGSRGPDGLKRKSPGVDEPSHLLVLSDDIAVDDLIKKAQDISRSAIASPKSSNLDSTSNFQDETSNLSDFPPLVQLIMDHRWNLVQALKKHNDFRAAFEAAWMAHYVADGLTPAHHFPLSEAKEELMTNKEFIKIFGEPIKGIMHGRSGLETARNNWLYWGAGGYMTKHVAFEYGVALIAAALPQRSFVPKISKTEFRHVDPLVVFMEALADISKLDMYNEFRHEGWTTKLALETKNILLPEIIQAVALLWYSAAEEAYHLHRPRKAGNREQR